MDYAASKVGPNAIALKDPSEERILCLQDGRANVPLSKWIWLVAALCSLWGAFSANPRLTPVAIITLTVCAQLLWRRGEPPVLVFACAMQWLQAAAVIFYTDFYGISLTQASGTPAFERATWLSLGAILALALGMRVTLIRASHSQYSVLADEASRIKVANAFIAYLVTFVVAAIAARLAFTVPAVTQVIFALVSLKWTAVFILAFCILEQRRAYIFLVAAVLIEVAVGMLGFFGSFKSVFLVLLVVVLASPLALRGKRLVLTMFVIAALFFSGVVWSAIKADYRDFLNQGSGQQVVVVSMDESIIKLADLLSDLTWDNFADGLDAMILRVGYIQFFALTLINVPDSVPHENGALWLGALKHIVTPRLFFPEKAAISDSERTTLYTGIEVAGTERGTSIGIGYVAESYVDFGPLFMFVPIFLLGAFFGVIYRFLVIQSQSKLICTAFACSILIFNAYAIETSNIKIVGGTVTTLLVVGVIYFFFGRALRAWLEPSRG